MAKYIPYNLNQDTLVVVNFSEQLKPGTFEFALNYLVAPEIFVRPKPALGLMGLET